MRISRVFYAALLIVVALVVQVSVLARLGLPGAVPDLLLLVVVALALTYGPTSGCVIGFAAGLCADLAPPADHAAGRYAFVLCLTGYVAGMFASRSPRRSVLTPIAVVAVAAAGTTVLYAAVGALVGDGAVREVGLTKLLLTAVLYDAILAPFVVPWVMALARKVDPKPLLSGLSR
ncbi:rod shape-determining protein MreD [Embleya hyalina]|uniref:Rod shape-determining protein MreD n=1 Tax=Embleya hyalina TaxID=516124 RepID=A0A401Z276_9ACTN|nr:rod shape-determining protein MreD [Embleya hyalina]